MPMQGGVWRSQLPLVGIVHRALNRSWAICYRRSPRDKSDFTAARATARRQRKLLAKRQPGDLGGLGCAPTNRPLVARAGCRIDGFRVEGGLDTSADWAALANDCRRPSTAPVRP